MLWVLYAPGDVAGAVHGPVPDLGWGLELREVRGLPEQSPEVSPAVNAEAGPYLLHGL